MSDWLLSALFYGSALIVALAWVARGLGRPTPLARRAVGRIATRPDRR